MNLRRTEAAQRLQGRDRLRRGGVVAHSNRDAGVPFFEIPNRAIRPVIMLIIIGFPTALVIA